MDAVYSTEFNEPVKLPNPLLNQNDLSIQPYNPQNLSSQVEKWMGMYQSKTILVSGHSNTIPVFAKTILGDDHFKGAFDESGYGNILIITIAGDGENKFLHVRY